MVDFFHILPALNLCGELIIRVCRMSYIPFSFYITVSWTSKTSHLQVGKDKQSLGSSHKASLEEDFDILNERSCLFVPLLAFLLLVKLTLTTCLSFLFAVMYTFRFCQYLESESNFISFHLNHFYFPNFNITKVAFCTCSVSKILNLTKLFLSLGQRVSK